MVYDALPLGDSPTLVVSNHTCVLDSVVAIHLSRQLGYDWSVLASPLMVDRFGWLLGARFLSVGIDGASVAQGIRRAEALLTPGARRLVWTYPQGDHVFPGQPLAFRRGVIMLLRRAPHARVVCAGIAYELFRRDTPMCGVGFVEVPDDARTVAGLTSGTQLATTKARKLLEAAAPSVAKKF